MSGNTSEPRFGPDNNLPMNADLTFKVTVPAHWKASFTFSTEAAFENAIVVYDGKSLRQLHIAGNHSRSLGAWTHENGDKGADHLIISGWHKKGAPNPSLPWNQSPARKGAQHGQSVEGGYEDWTDMDFNDIAFKVKVHK
jgi:hypothetical protein